MAVLLGRQSKLQKQKSKNLRSVHHQLFQVRITKKDGFPQLYHEQLQLPVIKSKFEQFFGWTEYHIKLQIPSILIFVNFCSSRHLLYCLCNLSGFFSILRHFILFIILFQKLIQIMSIFLYICMVIHVFVEFMNFVFVYR